MRIKVDTNQIGYDMLARMNKNRMSKIMLKLKTK